MIKLTQKFVDGLVGDGSVRRYPDAELPGFYLKVYASGKKVYVIRRRIRGKQREEVIASAQVLPLARARQLAQHRLAQHTILRIDPASRQSPPMTKIVERWQASVPYEGLRPATRKGYEQALRNHILPRFGSVPVATIERNDIADWLEKIFRERGERASTYCRAVLSAVYRYALERGEVTANLVRLIEPLAPMGKRKRVLSGEELAYLLPRIAKSRHKPALRTYLVFTLLTGQRPGEVRGLRWNEIDLQKKEWVIPGARTKNGHEHRIFLSGWAVEILHERHEVRESDLVFGALPETAANQACARLSIDLKRTIEFFNVEEENKWVGFAPHDFRRTMTTVMARLQIPREVRDACTNRRDYTSESHYNHHDYAAEKRRAWVLWEGYLRAASEGTAPY